MIAAATTALARDSQVSVVDVLVGVGWLASSNVENWQQGRFSPLAQLLAVQDDTTVGALDLLERWARTEGLHPHEMPYVARTRDRAVLQFTEAGDADVERRFRTHWIAGDLPAAQQATIIEKASKQPDLVVISPLQPFTCEECAGTGEFLIMEGPGALCLTCADLDHLVFLPAGNAALTRRSKKASSLSAVVVRFSRSRKRYERQGLLVEEPAVLAAEEQCLADADRRERRRERDERRRAGDDETFQAEFAHALKALFPGCPPGRTDAIAAHAAVRNSGRVARSAAGRALDPQTLTLAAVASIRHEDTTYDALLMTGTPRRHARELVRDDIDVMLRAWTSGSR